MPQSRRTPEQARRDRISFSADDLVQAAALSGEHSTFLVEVPTRRILACSGDISGVFGYRAEEIIGRDTDILHVDEAATTAFGQNTEKVLLKGADTYHGYFHMRRRNGETFASEHLIRTIRNSVGEIIAVISIVRDLDAEASETRSGHFQPALLCSQALRERLPGAVFRYLRDAQGQERFVSLAGSLFNRYGLNARAVLADASVFFNALVPSDRKVLLKLLRHGHQTAQPLECEVRLRTSDGTLVVLRILGQAMVMDDEAVVWEGLALDVTAERDTETQFHYLATHDPLTGLLNRAQFKDRVQQAIERAEGEATSLAVITLGVQSMAQINAAYNLEQGDALLKQIGQRLKSHVARTDVLARAHGDTFFVLLHLDAEDQALTRALNRLTEALSRPFKLDKQPPLDVAMRMGLALFPCDAADAATLLNCSSIAFERARRGARTSYEFYAPEFGERIRRRLRHQRTLIQAIANRQIVPYFQPQISLHDGSLVGLEALARWYHPDGEVLTPAHFIDEAESLDLITSIDLSILDETFQQLRTWLDAGLQPPPVAVNCSAHTLLSTVFSQRLAYSLKHWKVNPTLIVIELTESTFMDNFEAARIAMHRLSELGFRFAIDDFGTGFSSLSYLAHLPFSILKIDGSFVQALGYDPRQAAVCELLARMGQSLGMKVVAEGVETPEQATTLRGLGCPVAQGYLYAPPIPAASVRRWLT